MGYWAAGGFLHTSQCWKAFSFRSSSKLPPPGHLPSCGKDFHSLASHHMKDEFVHSFQLATGSYPWWSWILALEDKTNQHIPTHLSHIHWDSINLNTLDRLNKWWHIQLPACKELYTGCNSSVFSSGGAMGSCGELVVSLCWEDPTASFSVRMDETGAEPVLSMWCKAPQKCR